MNSWRTGVQAWPTAVRNWMPVSHSAGVRFDLAGEGVQVADGGVHDLLQARVGGVGHLRQRGVGDGVFVEVLHGALLCLVRGSIRPPRAAREMG